MNPQLTNLIAIERAADLRHDAQTHRAAAKSRTTGERGLGSLRVLSAAARFPFRLRPQAV